MPKTEIVFKDKAFDTIKFHCKNCCKLLFEYNTYPGLTSFSSNNGKFVHYEEMNKIGITTMICPQCNATNIIDYGRTDELERATKELDLTLKGGFRA